MSGYSTSYDQYLGKSRCCNLKVQGPAGVQGATGPAGIGPVGRTGPTGPVGGLLTFIPTNTRSGLETGESTALTTNSLYAHNHIFAGAVLYVTGSSSGYLLVTGTSSVGASYTFTVTALTNNIGWTESLTQIELTGPQGVTGPTGNTGPTGLNGGTVAVMGQATDLVGSNNYRVAYYNTTDSSFYYSTSRTESETVTTKTFVIDHPSKKDRYLVHACLEGPEGGVYYRGKTEIINNTNVTIYLPDYVDKLATDFTVQITPIYAGDKNRDALYTSEVEDNAFTVYGSNCKFYWLVHGKRCNIEVEPLANETEVKGTGPYKWI
jgi:hypothetical protein